MSENRIHTIISIRSFLDEIRDQGRQITSCDISSLSSIEKKDKYKKVFDLDILLTTGKLFGELENFYKNILKNIDDRKNGWNEFKPEFLIRLGYSLISQDKYDEGLAYVLQGYNLNPHKIQKVFRKNSDFDHFKNNTRSSIYAKLNYFTIYDHGQSLFNDINIFLNSFEIEEQLLIIELVSQFELHAKIIKEKDNLSSRRLIFRCLNQLCTLTESVLREKLILNGTISRTDSTTLGSLITQFKNQINISGNTWISYYNLEYTFQSQSRKICNSPNYTRFNRNLQNIKKRSESCQSREIAKYFLYLYCVRNYAGHHFKIKHARSEFLYKDSDRKRISLNAEIVFWSIFGALYYVYNYFR